MRGGMGEVVLGARRVAPQQVRRSGFERLLPGLARAHQRQRAALRQHSGELEGRLEPNPRAGVAVTARAAWRGMGAVERDVALDRRLAVMARTEFMSAKQPRALIMGGDVKSKSDNCHAVGFSRTCFRNAIDTDPDSCIFFILKEKHKNRHNLYSSSDLYRRHSTRAEVFPVSKSTDETCYS